VIVPTILLAVAVQGGDSLTLDSALMLAREHRAQVVMAAALVAEARADWRASVAIPNPTVTYSYTGDTPTQHVTIDQSLEWLIRRGSLTAAGRAGVEEAVADSVSILAQVERGTRLAYYAAMGAGRKVTLAREDAAIADSLAMLASNRFAAGEIARLDEAQAALEAARVRQLVSVSREEYAVAIAALGRALGIPAASLPPPGGALDAALADSTLPPARLEELPAVVAARAGWAAAAARFRVARKARIPLPSLQAGAEWNNPGTGSTVVLGVSLPFPLWQSGGAQAALAGARAEEARATLRETEDEAQRLLAETTTRVQETARRALVARDSILPLARRQRELALQTFQAGETDMILVLEMLRAERAVARALVDDLMAYQRARADWIALRGGNR